jgi:hypothetical protein
MMRFHAFIVVTMAAGVLGQAQDARVQPTRFWNDRELSDWALPVARLNVRPGHFSEREYDTAPDAEWVRTYPVYFPGREPAGYWETIQQKKPEPLISAGARTMSEWISAGRQVFQEMDVPLFRSTDPALIAIVRSADAYTKRGGHPRKDGTVSGLRWVPTSKGLALSISDCSGCHTRILPDGTALHGAQSNETGDAVIGELVARGDPGFFSGEAPAMSLWRQFAAPWVSGDVHQSIKTMTETDLAELMASLPPGTFARFNGSPYYPTQIPDLIGIKDRKYIDHTATHQMRGVADIMRYAAVVSCCDSGDFGTHRLLTDAQRRILYKIPDHQAFALAQYIMALEPPKNPNVNDPRVEAGREVFDREACGNCHAPPLYTNNKLTPAPGFIPPLDHPYRADIMPISVGTDPGLALKTRKGTGFYKVPSLKGVWYRGLLSHDGSVATLEDWFDPARLREDYVPTGFKGYKVKKRAVPGHEFGMQLSPAAKGALIAFLRSL